MCPETAAPCVQAVTTPRDNVAPCIQVRRAMEKENNKCRSEKRRKHNECVRALVAHVKKRDKRVAARQVLSVEDQLVEGVCGGGRG